MPTNFEAAGNRPPDFDLSLLDQRSLEAPGEALDTEARRICGLASVQLFDPEAASLQTAERGSPAYDRLTQLADDVGAHVDNALQSMTRGAVIPTPADFLLITEVLKLQSSAELSAVQQAHEQRSYYMNVLKGAQVGETSIARWLLSRSIAASRLLMDT